MNTVHHTASHCIHSPQIPLSLPQHMNELAKELIALNEITMALPDKEVVMMTSEQLQKILDIFDKSITLAIQVREQLARLRYDD
jgi:hypothetical protein